MSAHIRGIDHAIVCVNDLDQAKDTFERMGFTLTPRGFHSLGSENHLAMFGSDYLELFALPKPHSAFAYFSEFLASGDGLAAVALKTTDADAAHRALVNAGIAAEPPLDLARPVRVDGGEREARFRLVRLPLSASPGGWMFLCQHDTPELVWLPELQSHANGATGLAAVTVLCGDVDETATVHARLFGREPATIAEGLRVDTGGHASIAFVTERSLAKRLPGVWITAKPDPVMAALFIHVASRDEAEATLRRGGFHPTRMPDGSVAVGAAEAHGVAIVFG